MGKRCHTFILVVIDESTVLADFSQFFIFYLNPYIVSFEMDSWDKRLLNVNYDSQPHHILVGDSVFTSKAYFLDLPYSFTNFPNH